MTGPDRITAYNERHAGYSFTAFGSQPHFGPVEYVRADLVDAKDQHIKELQNLLAREKSANALYDSYCRKLKDALDAIADIVEELH